MSVSIEKIHKTLSQALIGTPMISGHGATVGKCTGVAPTKNGLQVYIEVDRTYFPKTEVRGFGFEIPLYHFLQEGQVPVCPNCSGLYEVKLSNDAIVQAEFDQVGAKWRIRGEQVGTFHEIRMPDWRHPSIVVGIKLLAPYNPGLKVVVVGEDVEVAKAVSDGGPPALPSPLSEACYDDLNAGAQPQTPVEQDANRQG